METLRLTRNGPVATIELNRPEAGNCLDETLGRELSEAAAALEVDDSVRAVVLTASGKFFCAGGDVKAMASFGQQVVRRVKGVADAAHHAVSSFVRMRAPVIVAVNGVTAGGGVGLAMAGDIVLAAETARFTLAYTNVGLSPDGSSTYVLPRLIGLRRTQELLFTNRTLSAQEAQEWGLVTRIVADAQLRDEALTLATKLANGPHGSHAAIKQLLLKTFDNSLESQMEDEGRLIARRSGTREGQEGIRAFCDKRAPNFNA